MLWVDLQGLVEGDFCLLGTVHCIEASAEMDERHYVLWIALGEATEFCFSLSPI